MSNPKEILKETIDGMIVREIFKQMMMREGLLVEKTPAEGGGKTTAKVEIDPQILNRLIKNLKRTGEFEGQRAYGVTADEVYATEGAPPKTNYSFISENLNKLISDDDVGTEWQNHPFTVMKKAQMFLESPSKYAEAGLKDSLSVFLLCDMLTSLFDTSKYDEDVAGKLFEYIVSGLSGGWVPRGNPLEDIYFEGKKAEGKKAEGEKGEKIGYSLKRITGDTIDGSLVNLYDALIRNPDGIEYLFIRSEGDKISLQKSSQITQGHFKEFLKKQYKKFKEESESKSKSKSKSPKRDNLNEDQASPTKAIEAVPADGSPPFTPREIIAISNIGDDVEFFNALKSELGDKENIEEDIKKLKNYFLTRGDQNAMNSTMRAIDKIATKLEKIKESGVKQDTYKIPASLGTFSRSYDEEIIQSLSGGEGTKPVYSSMIDQIDKLFKDKEGKKKERERGGLVEFDYESVEKLKDLITKLRNKSSVGVSKSGQWGNLHDKEDFEKYYDNKMPSMAPTLKDSLASLEAIVNKEKIQKEIPKEQLEGVIDSFRKYIKTAKQFYSPARAYDSSSAEAEPGSDFSVEEIFNVGLSTADTVVENKKKIRKIFSATGNIKIQNIINEFDELKDNRITATITIDLSKLKNPYAQARSGFEDDLRSFIEGLSETFKHLDVFFERYLDFVKDGGHRKFQSLGGDSLFRAYSAMDNTFYKRRDPNQDPNQLDLFSSQPDKQP